LSTNERISVGISLLRFLILFLNVFIIGARYTADRMGERAEPWPMPTFTLKEGDVNEFHEYEVERFE